MNSNSHTLTRGNKQFELCNHLGNVLVTVQDRKRSVDVNADNQADYYLPFLRTVTNYYAYGSAMPGIGGSIKECTVTSTNLTLKKYPYFYTFSNDSTSGFTAGSGARSVTNPTNNVLHLESIWTTRPLANKTIYLKNGVNYALKFNLAGFSVVSGYTHTVKVRILLPGNTLSYTYTATGNQTINFTSNTTGNVILEISSQITGSGTYSINPYIDIDNFNLSWDSAYTAYVNTCGSNAENYKYGFNTQEKDNEIAGENNFYTAEYWEYDARIARRWNVDPVDQIGLSNYNVLGSCPILMIDIKGNEFGKGSESIIGYKSKLQDKSNSLDIQNKKLERKLLKTKNETKRTKIQSEIDMLSKDKSKVDKAIKEIDRLEKSINIYDFILGEKHKSGNGETKYKDGHIELYFGDESALAHEIVHAIQGLDGKLTFNIEPQSYNAGLTYDLNDEIEAYQRSIWYSSIFEDFNSEESFIFRYKTVTGGENVDFASLKKWSSQMNGNLHNLSENDLNISTLVKDMPLVSESIKKRYGDLTWKNFQIDLNNGKIKGEFMEDISVYIEKVQEDAIK